MKANGFTRNDCKLGARRISYAALEREYRCNDCGGRLTMKWSRITRLSKSGWSMACARCGSIDFIHEGKVARQVHEAAEVIDGLPPELAALINTKEN